MNELNLSACSLPTGALRLLASVITASEDTLESLDLQANSWDMTLPNALNDWEEFLMSFKNCIKMRKVDLSDNKLGDKGIETLVRVYTREMRNIAFDDEKVNVLDEPLMGSVSNDSTSSDEEEDDEFVASMVASGEYGSMFTSPLAASAVIKSNRRPSDDTVTIPKRGLRSIAYIRLHNVGMTDLSALHLTYLLPYHPLPHVLLRRLDTQIPDSSVGRDDVLYDPDSLCRGVMYDIDNPEFTSLGKKILENVEKVRRAGGIKPPFPYTPILPTIANPGSVPPSPDSFRARRNSDSSKSYFPETPSPSRKESISSIRTIAISHGRSGSITSMTPCKIEAMPYWTEILKARPKIQGEILKNSCSLHISELWPAGIKLLSLGRLFTIPQPQRSLISGNTRVRNTKLNVTVKVSLPPSPVSPGTPKVPKPSRSNCIGGLDKKVWIKILLPIADPSGVLSERQAMNIIEWAADRATLAKEGEWAGKLPHVQMWKLLDVYSLPILSDTTGFGMFSL